MIFIWHPYLLSAFLNIQELKDISKEQVWKNNCLCG